MTTTDFQPHKFDLLWPIAKKFCHRWLIRRRQLPWNQIWCKSVHGGGFWRVVEITISYLYPLLGTHLQVRPMGRFSRLMAQTMRTHVCAFWGIVDISSHLRVKFLPNPDFWGVNRCFQAKCVKNSNFHILETTASIVTKFCTVIKTIKYLSWVVQMCSKQIQGGGRPPSWKIEKLQ